MSKRHIPIHDGEKPAASNVPAVADPIDATVDNPIIDVGDGGPAAAPNEVTPPEADAATAEAAPETAEPAPAAAKPAPSIDPLLQALASENDRLRKALDEKDALLQRYIAAHKKAEAEFAKVRARLEADLDRRVDVARGDLIKKLFPVLDDLERSLESARKTPAFDALVQGVDMVYKTFQGRLEDLGVVRFSPQGEAFDPGLHEAMGVLPAPAAEQNNTVLHVYQPGYRAGDQVLRAARVIVGKFGG